MNADIYCRSQGDGVLGARVLRISGVIIDLQMPGMTGIDLQDRLIADGYRKPIILMSALSEEDVDSPVFLTCRASAARRCRHCPIAPPASPA